MSLKTAWAPHWALLLVCVAVSALTLMGCGDRTPGAEQEIDRPPCGITITDAETGEPLVRVLNYVNRLGWTVREERPDRITTWSRPAGLIPSGIQPFEKQIDHGADGQVDEIWREQVEPVEGPGGRRDLLWLRQRERTLSDGVQILYRRACFEFDTDHPTGYWGYPDVCEQDGQLNAQNELVEAADGRMDRRTSYGRVDGLWRQTFARWDHQTGHHIEHYFEGWRDEVSGLEVERWGYDGRVEGERIVESADGQPEVLVELTYPWLSASPEMGTREEVMRLAREGQPSLLLQRTRLSLEPERHTQYTLLDTSGAEPVPISRWAYRSNGEGDWSFELDGRPGSPPDGQNDVVGRCIAGGSPSDPYGRLAWLDTDGDGEPEWARTSESVVDPVGAEQVRVTFDGHVRHRSWPADLMGPARGLGHLNPHRLRDRHACPGGTTVPDFEVIHAADGQFNERWSSKEETQGQTRLKTTRHARDTTGDGQIDMVCERIYENTEGASPGSWNWHTLKHRCEEDLDGDGVFELRHESRETSDGDLRRTVVNTVTGEVLALGEISLVEMDEASGARMIRVSDLTHVTLPDPDSYVPHTDITSAWRPRVRTSLFNPRHFAVPVGPPAARPRPVLVRWDEACRVRVE